MMMIIIYKVNWFDYDHHQCILNPYFQKGRKNEGFERAGSGKPDASC